MTLLWFFIWFTWNLVGDNEPLTFNPVNFWAGFLLLSIAVDPRRRARARPLTA